MLYKAVDDGAIEVVRTLLNEGANVNETDADEETPLHHAVTNRDDDEELIRLLIKEGADIEAQNLFGETALHLAANMGKQGIVKYLLDIGANANANNIFKCSPLHVAIRTEGDENVVKHLLDAGADVNAKNDSGDTPLHVAASNAEDKILQILLNKGANVYKKNKFGKTALHLAVQKCGLVMIEALVNAGADVMAVDMNGSSMLHCLTEKRYCHNEEAHFFLERDVNVDTRDKFGRTPLHLVALFSDDDSGFELAEQLLISGADVLARDLYNETPINYLLKGNEGSDERVNPAVHQLFVTYTLKNIKIFDQTDGGSGDSASKAVDQPMQEEGHGKQKKIDKILYWLAEVSKIVNEETESQDKILGEIEKRLAEICEGHRNKSAK